MARYLIRRVVSTVFLLAGVSVLSFLLVELAPGGYFDEMRLNPQISAATIAALRSQHGLDRSFPIRYFSWVQSVFRGEWGFSFAYNSPAAPILWSRARSTLLLTGTATFLAWSIAIPLGIWSAVRRGRRTDLLFVGTTSTLLAIPDVVLALALLLLAVRTGLFPIGGMASPQFSEMGAWEKCKDLASHLLLPTVCLIAGPLPLLLYHVRAAMADVLESPFITAARGYGIPLRRLLFWHALPAAANPLISLFGLSVGTLLSSSLVIEAIFGWPGLGQLFLEAILARDFYLVIGAGMLATVFLITGNLLADALIYASDPRIRAE